MTYDHPIWGEHDRQAAVAALGRLAPTPAERRAKAATERDKMYLDAAEALYVDGDDHQARSGYSAAMERMAKRFPDDLEVQAFYSLSLLGLTGTVRNTENYIRAAAIAEAVYAKNPKHPGALHYLIHAYDDPVHAPLGLRAARAYGTVARSASHAQHMPSHIFFALGMWEDSVAANTASMKTARDQGTGGYHPLHWLEHSYLQLGRNDDAAKALAIIEDDAKTITSPYNRVHLAMCRATLLVENRGAGPSSLMEPVNSTGVRATLPFAGHDMAIGLDYVRRKDLAAARGALERIRQRNAAMAAASKQDPQVRDRYSSVASGDVDTALVMEKILDSAIRFATGDRESAISAIVAAADAEDRLVFEYGPPVIVKPAWEAAGEMLLDSGRPKEAADAFRRVLKRYPNRRLSNEGLQRAEAAPAK
jgi:outer membrane protein assembly factor BamD (BamD/ComL family)